MRTLSDHEKRQIYQALEHLISGKQIRALCAYGSQIAGYARKESDYDVILVLDSFGQKIKYNYIKSSVECSALVVDSKSFENDCEKSSLGEFVSGRLLNPYESLAGKEYLRENEVVYKRRVIVEGLEEAYLEHGHFAGELEFGLPYFLFDKLRKRASIYPPVVYSYSQTYSDTLREENASASLNAFKDAAVSLQQDGLIDYDSQGEKIKIKEGKFKAAVRGKLSVTAANTARGLTQYAVHGYAGRVGLDVVGKEVMSKLSRSKEHNELPEEITSARRFWSLPEGKLFPETVDWLSDLTDYLGMDKGATQVNQKGLGEIYSSAIFYTLKDDGKSVSIAVKRYNDVKGMKWGLLNFWALKNTNFAMPAIERMCREYRAISRLRKIGVPTPSVLAVFLSLRLLVTGFIPGKDLSKIQSEYLDDKTEDLSAQSAFGGALATLHRHGFCMGDSKPSNAILSDKDSKIYLADLEQAHENGNPVWDTAEFIYYSVRFTLKEDKTMRLVRAFIDGYIGAGGNPDVIRRTAGFRYRAPFQAFIAPNVMSSLRAQLASV